MCINYYNYEKTGCITTIPSDHYNNNPEARTIEKCPTKCSTCSYESIVTNNNLCISCNIGGGYYPKEDDPNNINSFYECYQEPQTYYYLRDNIFKPCHSSCKTCSGEGDDENNNCLSCKVEDNEVLNGNCICTPYYNYEKTGCIETIPSGFYNDDTTTRTINKCPSKCSTCSYDSIVTNGDLCVSCNIEGGYYPKEDDPHNGNPYYECYSEDEIGYYLDKINNILKPCYSKCEACSNAGNDKNNNCISCKESGYEAVNGNCMCTHYYNYEKTGCIDTIPDGYYNDIISARTIEKCPNKCATCSLDSITNYNLCVLCDFDKGYYPKLNDPNNIDPFYECYQEDQKGFYLDRENNIFKPCYSKCKKCSGDGDDEHHNCLECIDDDGNNYNLTDGNCIDENEGFKYSYEVNSVSEAIKNDKQHTFIDMSDETISNLKSILSLGSGSKIYVRIVENDTSNLATADYTYEYILENGTKIDIDDIEEDIYIDVYVPLKDLDAANFELAKKYAEQGYDIYNLHNKLYTDFCTPVSLDGNDVPLAERKKEIYPNNITLCKDNCVYKGINLDERRVICQCNIHYNRTNLKDIKQEDETFVTYAIDYINYRLFLCYKLFFSAYYISHTFAFVILMIIFSVVMIMNFVYLCYSLDRIKNFLIRQMPSYNQFYKEINAESNKVNGNMNIIANPLKKELEKNKDKRRSTIKNKRHKSEKILLFNLPGDKYDSVNNKSEETYKVDVRNPKKEKTEKIEKRERKKRNSRKITMEKTNTTLREKAPIKDENEKKEEEDINELPYDKAVELDKRNVIHIYLSFLIQKLDFIYIFCNKSRVKIIIFIEYITSLLINFFLNALLYSDDIVSHKYHNNGKLDFAVSLVLSIVSNLVTSIICHYLNYSKGVDEKLDLILEVKNNMYYFKNIKRIYVYLRTKFICFFVLQLIAFSVCIYYIEIFCVKYYCSQISLLINYCYSFTESIITSLVITFIILVTRKIGLSCQNKDLYNTSKFIDNKT